MKDKFDAIEEDRDTAMKDKVNAIEDNIGRLNLKIFFFLIGAICFVGYFVKMFLEDCFPPSPKW